MTKSKSTEVTAFSGKTDIAARESRVGQGSQNVSTADMAIPRIKLLQATNPEVQPSEAQFVEGAQAGMLMNSLNNELYTSLFVINLHFTRCVNAWRKRTMGGGLFGSFDTEAEAIAKLEAEGEPVSNYDISENPTHLILLINEDGEPQGIALLDMPSSKIKKSKKWNSLIAEQEKQGNPRFGCVWQLSVVADKNNKGPFSNLDVELVAHAPDEIYAAATNAYDSFFPESQDEAA